MPSRKGVWGLLVGLGFLAGVVAACGGSTSSSTGPSSGGVGSGSSGAVVQGQVVNRRTAQGESVMFVVLRSALGIGVAEAAPTDPVEGVTVTLTRLDNGATTQGTTDASGQFTFSNVLPGTYTITVQDPGPPPATMPVDPPASFTVGTGDAANITVTVTESAVTLGNVTVVAVESDSTIVLQNPAQVAHLLNIAKAAGLASADPVYELRVTSHWGWGRIAKHFNVHPSVIGLGKGGVSDDEIAAFQASHGNGKGNGKGNGNGNGKGKGKKKGQA
jgi:hypothetical protein